MQQKNSDIGMLYILSNKTEISHSLIELVKDDDIVITMGAGDIWKYNQEFVNMLKR